MRRIFATKTDGVMNAVKDVKTDVQDFSGPMDEAEEHVGNVEEIIKSEKAKALVTAKCLSSHSIDWVNWLNGGKWMQQLLSSRNS